MKVSFFWKVTVSLSMMILAGNLQAETAFVDSSIGTLSEGSCWYEVKESLKVASFNDKSAYTGQLGQIKEDLETILTNSLNKSEKINEMDLSLHCSGVGASLVAKIQTDSGGYCVWGRFNQGHLSARSVGLLSQNVKSDLCDGRKWGEFILSTSSKDMIHELLSAKYTSMIKSVSLVSGAIYRVSVTKEFEFREQEVVNTIEENFVGKKHYNYIEYNEYRHSVGDWIPLK